MVETNGTTADPDPNPPAEPTAPATTDAKPDASAPDASAGTRKPRDARIIHLILASMGVSAYQERVPLMLMDFAYRASPQYA